LILSGGVDVNVGGAAARLQRQVAAQWRFLRAIDEQREEGVVGECLRGGTHGRGEVGEVEILSV
jgi:hypothetical protein